MEIAVKIKRGLELVTSPFSSFLLVIFGALIQRGFWVVPKTTIDNSYIPFHDIVIESRFSRMYQVKFVEDSL